MSDTDSGRRSSVSLVLDRYDQTLTGGSSPTYLQCVIPAQAKWGNGSLPFPIFDVLSCYGLAFSGAFLALARRAESFGMLLRGLAQALYEDARIMIYLARKLVLRAVHPPQDWIGLHCSFS